MWLTLIVVGVVLALLGVLIPVAKFLIWIGIVLLVASVIMSLVTRGRNRV